MTDPFPSPLDSLLHRPRRLRTSAALRAMVRETEVRAANLIQPFFVSEK